MVSALKASYGRHASPSASGLRQEGTSLEAYLVPPQGQMGHSLDVACSVVLTWTKGQVAPTPAHDYPRDLQQHRLTDVTGLSCCHLELSVWARHCICTLHIYGVLSSSQWLQEVASTVTLQLRKQTQLVRTGAVLRACFFCR